jgi:hypothetical protein
MCVCISNRNGMVRVSLIGNGSHSLCWFIAFLILLLSVRIPDSFQSSVCDVPSVHSGHSAVLV